MVNLSFSTKWKLHKILLKHICSFAKFPFWIPAACSLLFLSTASPILNCFILNFPKQRALEENSQQNKSVMDQSHLEVNFMTNSFFNINLIFSDVTFSSSLFQGMWVIKVFSRQNKSLWRENSVTWIIIFSSSCSLYNNL